MIRCIAVDDEPLALQKMKKYIEHSNSLELVGLCGNTKDAQSLINDNNVNLVFLDINMPDESGLSFARSLLKSGPSVVFTTAYPEFAVDGYKVDALDYMLKPFDQNDFDQVVDRIERKIQRTSPAPEAPKSDIQAKSIFVKTDYKIRPIKIDEIRYAESMGEYLHILVESETEPIITLLSMKKFEERLPKDKFMRVHRSFVINLEKVYAISKMRVMMDEDTIITVGDVYKDKVNAYIAENYVK